jgi:hypothetical protein
MPFGEKLRAFGGKVKEKATAAKEKVKGTFESEETKAKKARDEKLRGITQKVAESVGIQEHHAENFVKFVLDKSGVRSNEVEAHLDNFVAGKRSPVGFEMLGQPQATLSESDAIKNAVTLAKISQGRNDPRGAHYALEIHSHEDDEGLRHASAQRVVRVMGTDMSASEAQEHIDLAMAAVDVINNGVRERNKELKKQGKPEESLKKFSPDDIERAARNIHEIMNTKYGTGNREAIKHLIDHNEKNVFREPESEWLDQLRNRKVERDPISDRQDVPGFKGQPRFGGEGKKSQKEIGMDDLVDKIFEKHAALTEKWKQHYLKNHPYDR